MQHHANFGTEALTKCMPFGAASERSETAENHRVGLKPSQFWMGLEPTALASEKRLD